MTELSHIRTDSLNGDNDRGGQQDPTLSYADQFNFNCTSDLNTNSNLSVDFLSSTITSMNLNCGSSNGSRVNDTLLTDDGSIPLIFTQMSPTARNCVVAYIILFIISATGNFSVFFSVLQQLKKTKSRICVLILHLSLADLMVTFFVMPIEVIWRITVGWYGGNVLCKICQFLRAFGLYLSSMVLICISLDRYFAIIHPLRTSGAKRRGRAMLACAWISAAICSLPQTVIFHVQRHPKYPSFQQCVSMDYFQTESENIAYTVASVAIMYFLPLLVIIYTYGRIIWKINRKSRQHRESRKNLGEASGRILLRRSDASNHMERAKIRTLRLTLVIVLVFVMCWTPYSVITLWYMFDREEAKKVNLDVQEALFLMVVANSCVNPLVYGSYTKECRDSMTHCCIAETTRRRNTQNHLQNSKATISSRIMSTTGIGSGDSLPSTIHAVIRGNSNSAKEDSKTPRCQYHSQLEKNKETGDKFPCFKTKPKASEKNAEAEEQRQRMQERKENDLFLYAPKNTADTYGKNLNRNSTSCDGNSETDIVEECPLPNVMIPLKHYGYIPPLGQAKVDL